MAKDQELLQAVKSNDLNAFRKIAAKIKATKSSECFYRDQLYKHLKEVFVIFRKTFALKWWIFHYVYLLLVTILVYDKGSGIAKQFNRLCGIRIWKYDLVCFARWCLVRAYLERCWVICIHLNWNKLSFSQNFWKNHLLALIRNENHKDYLFKIKLVGLCQVANLMAISNSCLQFQQFSETIQEDIDSGYCLHAVLFYSDNISRDSFKNAFGWSIMYVSILCLYEVKCSKIHLGQIAKNY